MSDEVTSLLRGLLNLTGRLVFDEDDVMRVIGKQSKKLITAYNLCDGTRTQHDVSKKAAVDSGNFSRTVQRWVEHGILFRIRDGETTTLLHVFPIVNQAGKKRDGG